MDALDWLQQQLTQATQSLDAAVLVLERAAPDMSLVSLQQRLELERLVLEVRDAQCDLIVLLDAIQTSADAGDAVR